MNRKLFFITPLFLCILFLQSCQKENNAPETLKMEQAASENDLDISELSTSREEEEGTCTYRLDLYSGRIDVYGFRKENGSEGINKSHWLYCDGILKKAVGFTSYYIAPYTAQPLRTTSFSTNNLVRFIGRQNNTLCCLTPIDAAGNQIGTSICLNLSSGQTYDLLVNQIGCGILVDNCISG